MMDAKEALKELEDLTVNYGNRNDEQIARLDEAIDMAMDALRAQAKRTETHGVCLDAIDRQAAIDALEKVAEMYLWRVPGDRDSYSPYNEAWQDALNRAEIEIEVLPSAQPEPLSDAYTKAVWAWLLDYQIKAAKLKGRYTPYEVLSWVANDWRKEHE